MYWKFSAITTSIRDRMRDPSGSGQRFTDNEIYDAANIAIGELYNHVGFYVEAPPPVNESGNFSPPGYMVDQVLFVVDGAVYPLKISVGETPPENSSVMAWVYNSRLPSDTYTVGAELTPTATELVITGGVMPPMAGHVQVGLEIIRYNDVLSSDANTHTLYNLQRNMNGSGALTGSLGAEVDMVVYGDDPRLWDVIMGRAASYLHSLYPTDGSPTEVQHHQWMMRWHTQQVNNFWRSYTPRKENIRRPMNKGY